MYSQATVSRVLVVQHAERLPCGASLRGERCSARRGSHTRTFMDGADQPNWWGLWVLASCLWTGSYSLMSPWVLAGLVTLQGERLQPFVTMVLAGLVPLQGERLKPCHQSGKSCGWGES